MIVSRYTRFHLACERKRGKVYPSNGNRRSIPLYTQSYDEEWQPITLKGHLHPDTPIWSSVVWGQLPKGWTEGFERYRWVYVQRKYGKRARERSISRILKELR